LFDFFESFFFVLSAFQMRSPHCRSFSPDEFCSLRDSSRSSLLDRGFEFPFSSRFRDSPPEGCVMVDSAILRPLIYLSRMDWDGLIPFTRSLSGLEFGSKSFFFCTRRFPGVHCRNLRPLCLGVVVPLSPPPFLSVVVPLVPHSIRAP